MERGSYKGEGTGYTDQYPNIPEFQKPWEYCIIVGQGYGEISASKPLISEGFGYCSAVIIISLETNASLLLHLDSDFSWEIHDDGRSPLKRERYDVFLRETGRKIALPVNGDASYDRSAVIEQIKNDGVSVLPALQVNSDRVHWSLLYRPETREVIVDARKTKQTLSYFPFPPIRMQRIQDVAFRRGIGQGSDPAETRGFRRHRGPRL
jgi:hypothetical protein